jgi:hypothetical protein
MATSVRLGDDRVHFDLAGPATEPLRIYYTSTEEWVAHSVDDVLTSYTSEEATTLLAEAFRYGQCEPLERFGDRLIWMSTSLPGLSLEYHVENKQYRPAADDETPDRGSEVLAHESVSLTGELRSGEHIIGKTDVLRENTCTVFTRRLTEAKGLF